MPHLQISSHELVHILCHILNGSHWHSIETCVAYYTVVMSGPGPGSEM